MKGCQIPKFWAIGQPLMSNPATVFRTFVSFYYLSHLISVQNMMKNKNPILIKFFAKLSPLWFIDRTFKKFSHLISKKGSERCPNSEISQILRKVYQIFIFHHISNTE
jgi:hypothetical protein